MANMPPLTECKRHAILASERNAASATPQKQKKPSYYFQKWPFDRKFSLRSSSGAKETLRPSRFFAKERHPTRQTMKTEGDGKLLTAKRRRILQLRTLKSRRPWPTVQRTHECMRHSNSKQSYIQSANPSRGPFFSNSYRPRRLT